MAACPRSAPHRQLIVTRIAHMNATFFCPKCEKPSVAEVSSGTTTLDCTACGQQLSVPADAVRAGKIFRCLCCPSTDLFVRKDFPQRLGVTIVVLGIVASTIAWALQKPFLTYAILFATALIDLLLYLTMPDALMCYRCGAIYRGVDLTDHGAFSLETHERYRQQAARLAQHRPVDSAQASLQKIPPVGHGK
jgi:ribosomal protein L37AE/L43A